jgi:hypothetical protein
METTMDNMLLETAEGDTTIDATTASSVECQAWCVNDEGHPHEWDPLDRSCWGAEHKVSLSTEPTIHMGVGGRRQQYLNTYLEQQGDHAAPRVFIGHNEGKGKTATLGEARRFALEILSLVDTAASTRSGASLSAQLDYPSEAPPVATSTAAPHRLPL